MESKQNSSTTTTKISKDNAHKSLSKQVVEHGDLYSPFHARRKQTSSNYKPICKQEEEEMGVVEEMRRHVGVIKERMLEKLAAAAVPADALESARHLLETTVKDVTLAAHGVTKDALNRIKNHLVDILPSLSPAITRKMVDDAAKEANGETGRKDEEEEQENRNQTPTPTPTPTPNNDNNNNKSPSVSPTSSLFASGKPFSRL